MSKRPIQLHKGQKSFDFTIKSLLETTDANSDSLGLTIDQLIKQKTVKKIKIKISTEDKESHLISEAIDGYYILMELLEYDIDLVAKVINYQCKLNKDVDKSSCKASRIKCDCEHLRVGKYYSQIMTLCDSPHSYLKTIVKKLKGKK